MAFDKESEPVQAYVPSVFDYISFKNKVGTPYRRRGVVVGEGVVSSRGSDAIEHVVRIATHSNGGVKSTTQIVVSAFFVEKMIPGRHVPRPKKRS